jgi:hypothetical protein
VQVADTWKSRDYPVLVAIVTFFEDNEYGSLVHLRDIVAITGLPQSEVEKSMAALDNVFFDLSLQMGSSMNWFVQSVYPLARFATDQWPTAETLTAKLIDEIESKAENEIDQEQRGKLRQAAAVLGGTAKGIVENVLAEYMVRKF